MGKRSKPVRPAVVSPPVWWIYLGLAVLVALVFGSTVGHDFINFDDDQYVYDNSVVRQGVSSFTILWAFNSAYASNWHPLTWISHMLDCQMYGLNPWGHHLTNVLLHALAACLLFRWLNRLTSAFWPSALVAAIFAVHPLRVESVAWVAERKDLLCAVFFFLTLDAYTRYVRAKPGSASAHRAYGSSLLFLLLGLMSKPMLVTVPFVLLLLDYGPLRREGFTFSPSSRPAGLRRTSRVLEKIPFFALSVGSCALTVWAQAEVVEVMKSLPWVQRLENASWAYVEYLKLFFYPSGLAVLYPLPFAPRPLGETVPCLLILIILTLAFCRMRHRHPTLLVGWLWFLGMLVPVIGLLQVGSQSHADRYTYLPQVGVAWALVTWGQTLWAGHPKQQRFQGMLGAVVVLVLAMMAHGQVSHWKNSETLWIRTLEHTGENPSAQYNLGTHYYQQREPEKARVHLQRCIDSLDRFQLIKSCVALAHNNLGNVLIQLGEPEQARGHFAQCVEIVPTQAEAWNNLGNIHLMQGEGSEAFACFEKAVRYEPQNTVYLNALAYFLAASPNEAVRDGKRAVTLIETALQLNPQNTITFIVTRAAAYAEVGEYSRAIAILQAELETLPESSPLRKVVQPQISLYQSGQPLRDPQLRSR